MAAGHSSRMIEEKQYTHKPLLPILGLPNIERTILILNDFGINDIVIIAGIYADQYTFLQEKYGCTIVSDPNCSVSTLYGIYSIVNIIGDTFIIEGDVVLAENIFINKCLLIKQLSVTSNSYICSGHARIGTDAKEHKVFASES